MSPNFIDVSARHLTHVAARCAAAQWFAIGALTPAKLPKDEEVVDVEALILASLGLAEFEPRLGTLAKSWVTKNAELVSIARLGALFARSFGSVESELRALARIMERSDPRWKSLLPKDEVREPAPRPYGDRDRAMPPRWRGSRTLMLQLRRGMGVGVKPDLISILLGLRNSWTDVSTLTDLSGYTSAGVRRAADELADAAFIETTQASTRVYRARPTRWSGLVEGLKAPIWRRRADGFAFVLSWRDYLKRASASSANNLSVSIAFGKLMTDYWPMWNEVGVTQEPVSDDPSNAWAPREAAVDALRTWFGGGGSETKR